MSGHKFLMCSKMVLKLCDKPQIGIYAHPHTVKLSVSKRRKWSKINKIVGNITLGVILHK